MICATCTTGISHLGCVSHVFQLVNHDTVHTQTSAANLIKNARKIVMHSKHSEQACRKLVEFHNSFDLPEHQLLPEVETRWNSTYLMLNWLTEQHKTENLYCIERGHTETTSASQWELTERNTSSWQHWNCFIMRWWRYRQITFAACASVLVIIIIIIIIIIAVSL